MNGKVRHCFENIPNIDFFITRRTRMHIRQIIQASEQSIPKWLLGAWIHCPRKPDQPQSSSKKHFLMTLKMVLPELGKEGNSMNRTASQLMKELGNRSLTNTFREYKN